MRERHTELLRSTIYRQSTSSEFDTERIDCPSAMISLVIERADLKWKLLEAKAHFSHAGTNTLQSEIEDGTLLCRRFEASMDELHGQELDIRHEIARFCGSSFYRDLQRQRERIADLSQRCDAASEANSRFKTEIRQYFDATAGRTESDVAEAEMMMKLMRTLDQLRLRRAEQSERYVQLREAQVREVELVTELLRKGDATEVKVTGLDPFHMATCMTSDWLSASAVLPSADGGPEEGGDGHPDAAGQSG
jgi:hypothetical protein